MTTRTLLIDAGRVELDLSGQVVSLVMDDVTRPDLEPGVCPTPAPSTADFTSSAVLAHKAKQFDDGLRATMALLIQRDAGAVRAAPDERPDHPGAPR